MIARLLLLLIWALVGVTANAQTLTYGPGATTSYRDKGVVYQTFSSRPASVSVTSWTYVEPPTGVGNPFAIESVAATSVFTAAGPEQNVLWAYKPTSPLTIFDTPHQCAEMTMLVKWTPAGADCTASPSSCPFTVSRFGGDYCKHLLSERDASEDFTYATGIVAGQGIDQKVIDYYTRRGQLPIRWQKIDRRIDPASGQASSDTFWRVYKYASNTAWPHLTCVVNTRTNPVTTLPTFSTCAGN